MPTVLTLQHLAFEDLGYFNEILIRYGYHVHTLEVPVISLENIEPLATDVWIVLGGPIGVYETDSYPFLGQELDLIAKRSSAHLHCHLVKNSPLCQRGARGDFNCLTSQ